MSPAPPGGPGPPLVGILGIVLNVCATTGVVISNKALLTRQRFPFIITGLCLNFCTTFLVLATSVRLGVFSAKQLPIRDRWLVALTAVFTILFNNASVEANSVGTYQMAKLLIVPCIIFLERMRKIHRQYTAKMYVALVLIAVGVGLSTITDVELTMRGLAVGASSTILTAHYQIWQGSKQHEHGLTAQQITHSVMLPQILISMPSGLVLDVAAPWMKRFLFLPPVGLLERDAQGGLVVLSGPGGPLALGLNLVVNNLLAVGINLSTYYLIGATSPVTYQVVGQLKTVLIIAFGYLLFDVPPPPGSFIVRCFGMVLAISGVLWYGILKATPAQKAKGG
mmetsp:Transcript_110926/g.312724  ORF Transcript_110926/g.312724 Transcript_110926/m.312724 type:complete len:338 (-) Transcript_110926:98-1111(-)